jgi:hypothetical protein
MILADTSELDTIVKLLQQAIPNTTKSPLNQHSMADYYFGNYEGKTCQFNRVQAGELVGNVDSMEDELKRYYDSADETSQIIEGLLSPVKLYMKEGSAKVSTYSGSRIASSRDLGAKIFTYPITPAGFIEGGHSFTTVRMSELYAWIYRLDKLGVSTFFTNNWEETARFLIAVYKNEQKSPDSHTTFNRVYRPKVYIKHEKNMTKEELDTYRLTKSLMFLSSAYGLGIGEVKAKALADKFCNILDIAMASVPDLATVEGIGTITAKKILSSLGRSV